jgi:hypothetical protein
MAASVGIGLGRTSSDARLFASSKNVSGSLIKADCNRLTESTVAEEARVDPTSCPVGPFRDVLGLRRGARLLGSGGGASPRLIARLSCSSALCCFPDAGFRRGILLNSKSGSIICRCLARILVTKVVCHLCLRAYVVILQTRLLMVYKQLPWLYIRTPGQ